MDSAITLKSKFEERAPAPQNAFDIFEGRWASEVGEVLPDVSTGGFRLFKEDARPRQAAEALGRAGRLDDMHILELGPLDGAHTYQLQQLGAKSVLAIEANAEAFLKCLIVKEYLGLDRTRFDLGDFLEFFDQSNDRFDMIFCSGVLYHMSDPLRLLHQLSNATDKCFIWTHYFDEELEPLERVPLEVERYGYAATYHEAVYPNREKPTFWGGNKDTASWVSRADIIGALGHFGFTKVSVIAEDRNVPIGPWITIAAEKA